MNRNRLKHIIRSQNDDKLPIQCSCRKNVCDSGVYKVKREFHQQSTSFKTLVLDLVQNTLYRCIQERQILTRTFIEKIYLYNKAMESSLHQSTKSRLNGITIEGLEFLFINVTVDKQQEGIKTSTFSRQSMRTKIHSYKLHTKFNLETTRFLSAREIIFQWKFAAVLAGGVKDKGKFNISRQSLIIISGRLHYGVPFYKDIEINNPICRCQSHASPDGLQSSGTKGIIFFLC